MVVGVKCIAHYPLTIPSEPKVPGPATPLGYLQQKPWVEDKTLYH